MTAKKLTPPTCAACGRSWFEERERWRASLVAAEEREREFDGPDVAVLFCAGCAEEFED